MVILHVADTNTSQEAVSSRVGRVQVIDVFKLLELGFIVESWARKRCKMTRRRRDNNLNSKSLVGKRPGD